MVSNDRWNDVLTAIKEQGFVHADDVPVPVANALCDRGWLIRIDDRYYLDEVQARQNAADKDGDGEE
ncbi:hypothetical protein [Halobacterium sp. R2-5]|uniref:hypothetical protein n=1 Tax=Halobacterium sp. R2-5 TaxID=2715751 RepID=UPI0014225606|nr:hypothetical protein [Halobacterium sp. R2-5]NIB98044.1 hypothetical protein [Halobacterium sp. R2-5]